MVSDFPTRESSQCSSLPQVRAGHPERSGTLSHDLTLRQAVTVSSLLPSDDVVTAYRQALSWQYERSQLLNDRHERLLDELDDLKSGLLLILEKSSRALLEKSLRAQFAEDELKRKRREKFQFGGFDAKKALTK